MAEIQITGKKITDLPEKLSLDGEEYLVLQDSTGSKRVKTSLVRGQGGGSVFVDAELSETSENPVQNKVITEKINELLMLTSTDYGVGGWVDGELSPVMEKFYGEKEYLNAWNFYLLDTTDNAGQTTTPVGKLKRGNLFRFEDGTFAPTVGITEAQYNECMGHELTVGMVGETAYEQGGYDAEAEWEIDKALILQGQPPRELWYYDEAENLAKPVSHKLRPWETTETKYTIGIGRDDTIYLLDNVKGTSGKVWKGLFSKAQVWDGVDVSAYPLAPTAISPCPVCTVGGKTRSFFYLYEGETNCKSSAGQDGLCTLFQTGRTYPRAQDVSQITNMNQARANNADTTLPYPFAEGGYHALNAYVTAMEVYYGTKYLHNNALFGGGISSNDSCNNETNWLANGGVRYKPSDGDTWKYALWSGQGDIYYNSTGSRGSFSVLLNLEWPKEQCMESQMVASYASEMGIAEGMEFDFYGATYWYKNVPGTAGLDGMDVKVFKKMSTSFSAFNADGVPTDWDVEVILRMSLIGGANLSGDVFAYWGGGYEQVGTCIDPTTSSVGNPVALYMEPDQTKWLRETTDSKANLGMFDFESAYPKKGETTNKANGYALARAPYCGYKTENGGGLSTGECFYGTTANQWSTTLNQRRRIAARFRGFANYGACSPRFVNAYHNASVTSRNFVGSAQALIGGAAALQAQ